MAKRAGKTEWADRRRPSTRRSGFTVNGDTTGGEMQVAGVGGWRFRGPGLMRVRFEIPPVAAGTRLGWGAWFYASGDAEARVEGFAPKCTLEPSPSPDWGKVGSIWTATGEAMAFEFVVEGSGEDWVVALYDVQAGAVEDDPYDRARESVEPERWQRLMSNMWAFAPEANFVSTQVHAEVSEPEVEGAAEVVERVAAITLKSCNRCGRFLPINVHDERRHLSFSNHCVARHPCPHSTFGRLRDTETGKVTQFEYGFQLECRFCKKFAVNAPHNPQRTASQMKEDGTRRREIEALLIALYSGSPSLLHRKRFGGRELVEEVWRKFDGRCFKCGTRLGSEKDMCLDHTRPLALLWPLDESATCLCATHNSAKRDRPPAEFYDADELGRLAAITGLGLEELRDPSPNREAIASLAARLDWFFDEFLQREELQTERDGKLPADLLVKAVQRALGKDDDCDLDLVAEYERRRPQ